MKNKKVVIKTVFYLFIATMLLGIILPIFFFLSTSFYSGYEMYQFPKAFFPKSEFDFKVTWENETYNLFIYEEQLDEYELLISSSKPEEFRRFMKRELSVVLDDERIGRDFSKAKNSQSLYITYKKDIFYNYKTFFTITNNAKKAIVNSIVAAGWTILISLTIGSMAGYAMARFRFLGRDNLSVSLLLVRMFPGVAVSIPMLVYLIKMGLDGTMFGLAIVYSVGNIALTAWITNSIFQGISVELEEASQVFGATKIQTFFKITLPIAVPGLIACSMYAFLAAWNDSITALILSSNNPTLSLLIYKALGTSGTIQLSAAGAVILFIPALVFTFIIKNYINQLWGDVKF